MTTLLECSKKLGSDADEKCICETGQTNCMPVKAGDSLNCHVPTLQDANCNRQQDLNGQTFKYAMGSRGQLECCESAN